MQQKITKTDLTHQYSLTGVRALAMLGLLLESPRSLEEIKSTFIKSGIMSPEDSIDVLRVDLNTLRTMNCEIEKRNFKNKYTYSINKQPFGLEITKEEVLVLKKVYKRVKFDADINLLIEYDKMFRKFAEHIKDEDIMQEFFGISILKNFIVKDIEDIILDCKNKATLKLLYSHPTLKKDVLKEVVAQDLVFKNDKIYLRGYDIKYKKHVILNFKRIKKILEKIFDNNSSYEVNTLLVTFLLKKFGATGLDDNEKLISTTENGYIIQGNYYNEFYAIQRILSFGADCIILEPEELKIKILEKLKSMRKIYYDR